MPPNSRTFWVPSSLGGFRCQGEWRENSPSQGGLRRGTPGQLVTLRSETSALETTGRLQHLKVRGSAISEDSHVLPLLKEGTDSSEYNASQPARASGTDPRILHGSTPRRDRTSGASFGDLPGAGQRIVRRKGHGQWSGSRALEWRDLPPATRMGSQLAQVGLPGSTHGVPGGRARRGSRHRELGIMQAVRPEIHESILSRCRAPGTSPRVRVTRLQWHVACFPPDQH